LYGAVWGIFRKSAVTPARQPSPLANASMLLISTCLTQFEDLPVGDRGNQKLCTVSLRKIAVPRRKSQIADRKIADKLYCKSYENFQSPGFPHNFSRNYPQNSNMSCIDVSDNLFQKLGFKINFPRKYGYFTLHTKGSKLLPYATAPLHMCGARAPRAVIE
jgi:hypothetical protein